MSPEINFNGKTYYSVNEMAPAERQAYEMITKLFADEDQNGVPDLLENVPQNTSVQTTTFVVDGKTYASADEMPTDARQRYQAAMSKIEANQNNVPGWLQTMASETKQPQRKASQAEEVPAWLRGMESNVNDSPAPSTIVTEPEGADLRLAMIGCAFVIFLIVAGGAFFVLFR